MTTPGIPGMNPKAMEAWFTLMAQAMRGAEQAQQAFDAYARMSGTSDEWRQWMSRYLPGSGAAMPTPDSMETWVEEWQRMMGVVPRERYLELLATNAELERRLETAEATIAGLRALLSGRETQEETAKQVVDTWSKMLDDTLRIQAEWVERWSGGDEPALDAGETKAEG